MRKDAEKKAKRKMKNTGKMDKEDEEKEKEEECVVMGREGREDNFFWQINKNCY